MKEHWENIYANKQPDEVSWTQTNPTRSLAMIEASGISKNDPIIDVGGGDSPLAGALLSLGYRNITVLDISGNALARGRKRLGYDSSKINWVESDVLEFRPATSFALWHDRAAFHFLIDLPAMEQYAALVRDLVTKSVVLGSFSIDGPDRCSALPVRQYDESSMDTLLLSAGFYPEEHQREDHITPFGTTQNFLFGRYRSNNTTLGDIEPSNT